MKQFRIVHDDLGGYAVQTRDFANFWFFWSYIFPGCGNHKSFQTLKEAEDEMKKLQHAEIGNRNIRKKHGRVVC